MAAKLIIENLNWKLVHNDCIEYSLSCGIFFYQDGHGRVPIAAAKGDHKRGLKDSIRGVVTKQSSVGNEEC